MCTIFLLYSNNFGTTFWLRQNTTRGLFLSLLRIGRSVSYIRKVIRLKVK